MPTRRHFLQSSALVSLAPLVPTFLSRSALAADSKTDGRKLVVIQLDGGNDGLNTIIPFADENYARHRRELRIKTDEIHKINDSIGFNPEMKSASDLLEEGRLSVIQGVGYPNPNRSHFESMAIWHHARLQADDHDGNGWLGRATERTRQADSTIPDSIYVGADAVPVALRGRRANAVALQSEADLHLAGAIPAVAIPATSSLDISAFVQRSVAQSFDAARQFREASKNQPASDANYPQTKLGEKLRLVSKLLKFGGTTSIYYVSQPGYDTHAAQNYPHSSLLREFAGALKAFLNDLKAARLDNQVLVLAFSEFGRRVAENDSLGTDHGTAGPVFLAGPQVRPGLIGSHPSLTDLDEGDLKMAFDFRHVYATLLDQWLRVDSSPVLSRAFEHLPLLA